MKMSIEQIRAMTLEAFGRKGVTEIQSVPTTDALIQAEAQGMASHGISRVPMYLAHVAHRTGGPQGVAQGVTRDRIRSLGRCGQRLCISSVCAGN